MKIAISGKGGVGKTTLSSLLAASYAADGLKVIAIDADPDANLATALGISSDTSITPLVELKELIKERVGADPGQATVYFKMNPRVDDIPDRFSVRKDGVRLMVMGTIRGGGKGCACPENAMIKQLLGHLLLQRDEMLIMDMEAGIEHLGRGTARFVDHLLAVVEPGILSVQTYHRIKRLAADLGIRRLGVVANRVRSADDVTFIERETGAPVLAAIDFHESLHNYTGGPVGERVAGQIYTLKDKLAKELLNG